MLAAIAAVVGLGNIWRFPYLVGVSGGGAFLIPYVIAILACGLPVFMLELAMGRKTGRGIVGTFGAFARWAKPLAVLVALGGMVLLSYYLVITGWAVGYFVMSVGGVHPTFSEFTSDFTPVAYYVVAFALTVGVVALGVRSGIEASSKLLMPVMVLILVGLAIYSAFLPGWGQAMRFYLYPDLSRLADAGVWVAAFGQVFFSFGVGLGILVTYGAYMSARENIPRSVVTIAVVDVAMALIAGLVIFPLVFSFGGEPGAGPQLAFANLPLLFDRMNPVTGYVLGLAFYLMLAIAAVTSAVSFLEMGIVALGESVGFSRRKSLVLLSVAVLVLGLPSALSYSGVNLLLAGRPVLDVLDDSFGRYGLPVGVLITAAVLGWMVPLRSAGAEIGKGFVGWSCIMLVRFVVPVVVIAALARCVWFGC